MQPQDPAADPRRRPKSSVAAILIVAIALLYTLHLAAELLTPIALAALLSLTLSPASGALVRRGVPAVLSAALLVAVAVGIIALLISTLAGPAEQWLQEAPRTIRELREEVVSAQDNLGGIQELAQEVENLAAVDDAPQEAQAVVVKGPGLLETFMGGLPTAVASASVVVFLTFFLLAFGDQLLRHATRCGRTWTERRRIVMIARDIQAQLGRYLATVTIINFFLGLAVAGVIHLFGIPNPLLWGAMVAIFNFAPYVGAVASMCVLAIVGISTLETLGEALMLPLVFFVLTTLEGQLITPAVLGQRMSLSPIVVFLAVIVWGWLWGIIGALIAVPLVTSLIVMFEKIPGFELAAGFLRGGVQKRLPDANPDPAAVPPAPTGSAP